MSEKMVQNTNSNPHAGAQSPTRGVTPVRPATVGAAFGLLLAAAALVLLRIPVGMWAVNKDENKSVIEDALGPDNVSVWVAGEISGYVWLGVITAVLLAGIALLARRGLGWPRIVLIVVVIFTALNTRVQFFASLVTVYETAWVTVASVLLSLAATVLLFLKPSNEYFKVTGQYRKGRQLSQA